MFRPLCLTKDSDTVSLVGQLKRGCHYAMLPSRMGVCRYSITVNQGVLRLNHMAYNPDGGAWSCSPKGRQQAHYDLQQGQSYEIQLTVDENFQNADKVYIVNTSMLHGAEFSYSVKFGVCKKGCKTN